MSERFQTKQLSGMLIRVQDKSTCVSCRTCVMVCPAGVYGISKNGEDIVIIDDSGCLKCNGCVRQCPQQALYFR